MPRAVGWAVLRVRATLASTRMAPTGRPMAATMNAGRDSSGLDNVTKPLTSPRGQVRRG